MEGGMGHPAFGVGDSRGGRWLAHTEVELGWKWFVTEKLHPLLDAGWFSQRVDEARGWQSRSMRSGVGE
jgi:hypothetical protein